jgi:hypothetical protein
VLRQSAYRTAPFALETNYQADPGEIPFPTGLYDFVLGLGADQADIFPFPYFADEVGNPRVLQWNFNVQRQILPSTGITVGYAGSRGLEMTTRRVLNAARTEIVNGRYVFPTGARRPNQHFDLDLASNTNTGDSWYHALQVELQRRFSANWQAQFAYTWSKALDLVSSSGPESLMYHHAPELSKGLAGYDVRHRFTGSFVWQMPGRDAGGVLGNVFGGWQLGGILNLTQGNPVQVSMGNRAALANIGLAGSRPDLIPGGDNNPILGDPDRYFDPTQFVLPPTRAIGNVGRNTLIEPSIATVDVGLTKNIPLGTKRLQLRVEAFNLLNRANLGAPDANVMNGTGRRNANAGFISTTSTAARQMQLGARFEW